ncbi:MAG TPA: SGNH/GDSL hydrolase family protein [Mycobacteriales bacterium]
MTVARFPRRHRVLAAALALAGSGALAFVVGTPSSGRHAPPPPLPSSAIHISGESAQAITAGRLLFVGASYSIGLGATAPSNGYPSLLADRLHRPYTVDAVSGTGFQNPGRHHAGTFAQRIARVPTLPAPRIVIIQGGRDDTRYPGSEEYAAVLGTITLAQRRFTAAQVVVLGPIPASLPVSAKVAAIRSAIGRACATAHAGFIDPITQRWITPANEHLFGGHVRGHPNDAGYAYIAGKLMAALPAALKAAQPPLQPAPVPAVSPSAPTLT